MLESIPSVVFLEKRTEVLLPSNINVMKKELVSGNKDQFNICKMFSSSRNFVITSPQKHCRRNQSLVPMKTIENYAFKQA